MARSQTPRRRCRFRWFPRVWGRCWRRRRFRVWLLLYRVSLRELILLFAHPSELEFFLQRKMTQCPDAHLFCTTCVISYASTLLGEQNHQIACMDQSGCKLLFSPIELRRFLPPKLLELYERICQRKELEAAGLEGLEECPFCEYQVVIENEHEKLFRCERPDCGAVTCRKCKKMVSISRGQSYTKPHAIFIGSLTEELRR